MSHRVHVSPGHHLEHSACCRQPRVSHAHGRASVWMIQGSGLSIRVHFFRVKPNLSLATQTADLNLFAKSLFGFIAEQLALACARKTKPQRFTTQIASVRLPSKAFEPTKGVEEATKHAGISPTAGALE